jgi:hypothetical protein
MIIISRWMRCAGPVEGTGEMRNASKKLKRRNHLEYLDVYGRIISVLDSLGSG